MRIRIIVICIFIFLILFRLVASTSTQESLGGIKIGDSMGDVKIILGEPSFVGDECKSPNAGLDSNAKRQKGKVEHWEYCLEKSKKEGASKMTFGERVCIWFLNEKVYSIKLEGCNSKQRSEEPVLRTSKGISYNDSRSKVLEQYGNPDNDINDSRYYYRSIGLSFWFCKGIGEDRGEDELYYMYLEGVEEMSWERAIGYYKWVKDYSSAHQLFLNFISKYKNSPKTAEAWYYMGKCNIKMGKYESAVHNFRQALKYDPYNELYLNALLEVSKLAPEYKWVYRQYEKEFNEKKKEKEKQANLAKKMSQVKKVLPIAIGDSLQDCLQSLGSPDFVGEENVLGQTYRWSSKGIGVLFSPSGYAKMMIIQKPCKYMTKEGIRIGDKKSKVLKVYGSNWRSYDGGKTVLIYDYYEIMFTFKKGLVSSISLGGP